MLTVIIVNVYIVKATWGGLAGKHAKLVGREGGGLQGGTAFPV